jgi:hypothetical protein
MLSPNKHAISVIVGRLAPKGPESEEKPAEREVDEGLVIAARDILVALGMDSMTRDSDSAMQAFEDRARHLAEALAIFVGMASSGAESPPSGLDVAEG